MNLTSKEPQASPDPEVPSDLHFDEKVAKDDAQSTILKEDDPDSAESFLAGFTNEERKKVVRKVDWRLIPVLNILYIMAYIDRSNIANAKIEGLTESLNMSGSDYNVALSIFFVPYVLFEIPSNYVLKRYFHTHPSWWIGFLTMSWGTVMTLTGIAQSYQGLVVTRFFLGLCEAGFFPGAILLTSQWYLRNELHTRIALFYTASAVSGAFSGLLAYGIVKMDGTGGLEGWRWIFLLEGIASVAAGLLCFIFLADAPEKCKWLTSREVRYLRERITQQNGGKSISEKGDRITWSTLIRVVKDWKLYLCIIIWWSNVTPSYGLKFTMPEIITTMGFSAANAQLLTIPPYFCGGVATYLFAIYSDRFVWRMPFIMGPQTCVLIAFSILFPLAPKIVDNIGPCYFAICLACIGLYPIPPGASTWTANNLAGDAKRTVGLAYFISIGNTGSLIGSFIYLEKEYPRYPTGFGTSLGFAAGGIVSCLILDTALYFINRRDGKLTPEEVHEKYTDKELADMGDKSPLYKYTL